MIPRIVAIVAGVWLMFAPEVLGYDGVAADVDRIAGPVAASAAFVACWAVVRPLRWLTAPVGVWLVAAPLVLAYDDRAATASSVLSGLVLAGTAWFGGDTEGSFGGGWRSIRPSAWQVRG